MSARDRDYHPACHHCDYHHRRNGKCDDRFVHEYGPWRLRDAHSGLLFYPLRRTCILPTPPRIDAEPRRHQEAPTFHQYLESQVLGTASPAVVGDYTTAAQFQVINGQLIQNAGGKNLYAIVQPPLNSTVTKLGVTWATTPDTLGIFVFSGDSLEWSSPSVTRQQTNAWLVCPSGTTQLVCECPYSCFLCFRGY
jgi:hypothetical protein